MKKVAEVRERRENRFWENRMILASKQKHKDVMVELEKNPSLISDKETRNQVVENKNLRIKEEEQRKVQKGKLEVVEME